MPTRDLELKVATVRDEESDGGGEDEDIEEETETKGDFATGYLDWRLLTLGSAALASLTLLVFAFSGRAALSLLLFLLTLLLLIAATLTRSAPRSAPMPQVAEGGVLLLLGFLIMVVEVTVQLCFIGLFGGSAADLDFGSSAGLVHNLALEPSLDGVVHCALGFLAMLLFPVSDVLHPCKCCVSRGVKDSVGLLVVVFPLWDFVGKASARNSASEFGSDIATWAGGVLLGICMTFVCSGIDGHREESFIERREEEDSPTWDPFIRNARLCAGILLCSVAVMAGVVLGIKAVQGA